MSKLTELLDELCPDGVEYRPFSEVIERLRTGLNPRKNFILNSPGSKNYYITVRELGGFNIETTEKTDLVNDAGLQLIQNRSGLRKGDVLFSGTGTIGRTALVSTEPKDWNIKEGVYALTPDHSILDSRFLVYALNSSRFQNAVHARAAGGTVKSISMKNLSVLTLPIPPLEVQQEIVRVLDAFTALEQSLVSELELRKKQYVEYRDTAIEDLVNGNAPSVNLGDHARTVNGLTGKNKSDFSDGNAKFITYRNVFSNPEVDLEINDYVKVAGGEKQNQVELGDVIFTGSSESREEVGFSAVVTRTPAEPIYLNSFCFMVRFEDPEFIDPGFAKHMFRSRPIRKQIMKAANGVTRINISKPRFMRVEVPVPPMEMQQEIAVKLDAFSSLIQSIEQEISLRRTQYEFYRDELLSFAPQED